MDNKRPLRKMPRKPRRSVTEILKEAYRLHVRDAQTRAAVSKCLG